MGDDLITNRKAHRDFQILETYEAGIVLRGSEVKSLRAGQGNLTDAFARIEKDEVWLYNFDIQPYKQANQFNHEPKAVRRLLLHRQEIRKLFGIVAVKGRTLVALKMYWKKSPVEGAARRRYGQERPRQARGPQEGRRQARDGPGTQAGATEVTVVPLV